MGAKPIPAVEALHAFDIPRPTISSQWTMTAAILSADLLALSVLVGVSVIGRHLVTPAYQIRSCVEMLPCLLLLLVAFGAKGLYPGILIHPAEETRRVFVCASTVFLLLGASTYLWRNGQSYSRSVFLISWAAGAPLLLITRYLARRIFAKKHWWGIPAVVFGSGPTAERVVRKLRARTLGLKVIAVLSDAKEASWPEDLPVVLGNFSATKGLADVRAARYAIIALPQRSNTELSQMIQNHCRGFSHVLLIPDMPGLCSLGISAREIRGEVAFELPQRLFHQGAAIAKRILDLSLGAIALLLSTPLLLSVAALIKLTSCGPIFYRQERYGHNGRTFSALKFRTMTPDADRALADHLAKHPDLLTEWHRDRKLKDDPRVTPVGKWLRRFSMDELPQILNVLCGDMSLVGPRPIPLSDLDKYGPGYDLYTRVRPGITGLWQVSGRNNTTYEERVAFDEYYVRNWSIWLDTYILISTLKAVLTAEGAY